MNPRDNLMKEIIQKQAADRTINTNSEKIKRIDGEIYNILKDKNKKDVRRKEVDNTLMKLEDNILEMEKEEKEAKSKEKILKVGEKNKKAKRCKYFNVGYCKYKDECKFIHPKDICKGYLQGKCSGSDCQGRHPKACKWFERETACKRKDDCEFSHDTLACSDRKNL